MFAARDRKKGFSVLEANEKKNGTVKVEDPGKP